MDSFLDLDDLDLETDPIKQFLNFKLDQLKDKCQSLNEAAQRRNDILNKLKTRKINQTSPHVNIAKTSTKICNGKYVLAYKITTAGEQALKTITPVLTWDLKRTISYSFTIFTQYRLKNRLTLKNTQKNVEFLEGEWIRSNEIKSEGVLVVAFQKIQFIKFNSANVTGFVKFTQNNEDFHVPIDEFTIKPSDCVDIYNRIENSDLLNAQIDHRLMFYSATKETKLLGISTSTWDLNRLFEMECGFRKINSTFSGTSYLIENIGGLKAILISLRESEHHYYIRTFTESKNQLVLIVHHLYNQISNLILVPYSYKNKMREPPEDDSPPGSPILTGCDRFSKARTKKIQSKRELLKKCTENLKEKIEFTKKNCTEIESSGKFKISDRYSEFRKCLARLELDGDLLKIELK